MSILHLILKEATLRLEAACVSEAQRKAELALARELKIPRLELALHRRRELTDDEARSFHESITRLEQHEPWQYITGETDFLGRTIRCSPAALIPRPETEDLATKAAVLLREKGPGAVAADIGTGTGCIAIHLALENPMARVFATDICHDALDLARENAKGLGAEIIFLEGDLAHPLPEPVDILISNPPYIGEAERAQLDPQVREYEPHQALFGGQEGHELPFRLLHEARQVLRPGGNILLEIGASQGILTLHYMQELGYVQATILNDLRGLPRIATAVWNGFSSLHASE